MKYFVIGSQPWIYHLVNEIYIYIFGIIYHACTLKESWILCLGCVEYLMLLQGATRVALVQFNCILKTT